MIKAGNSVPGVAGLFIWGKRQVIPLISQRLAAADLKYKEGLHIFSPDAGKPDLQQHSGYFGQFVGQVASVASYLTEAYREQNISRQLLSVLDKPMDADVYS